MKKIVKDMDRRAFLKYSAMLSAGAAFGSNLFSPLQVKAAEKEVFTIALQGGTWGEGEKEAFVKGPGFQAKHNLDVRYDVGDDGRLLAKGLANCNKPIFDAHLCFGPNAAKHYASGCAMDLDLDMVPNWKDLYPAAQMGTYSPSFCFCVMALVYNKNKVSTPPQSYDDLWDPKYKGRIGIPKYTWIGMYWIHAINKYFGGKENDLTPAIDKLADLMKKQKPVILNNVEHTMRLFRQEELWLAPFWDGRTLQMQKQGLPMDITFNKDMFAVGFNSVGMKGVKNPKLVNEFIDITCISLSRISKNLLVSNRWSFSSSTCRILMVLPVKMDDFKGSSLYLFYTYLIV